MALLDRIGSSNSNSITSHAFSAGLNLLAIGSITRQQLVDRFSLTAEDQIQLDEIITHYNSLNNNEKGVFFGKLESLNILREEGYITTQEYKNLLDINT